MTAKTIVPAWSLHAIVRPGALLVSSLLLVTTLASAHPRDHAKSTSHPFTAVYVFGDSLSDTGRTAEVLQPAAPPVTDWLNGRECNGPLWVDYLSPALGLLYEPANNFAWGGATSGAMNTNADELPGLAQQLVEFMSDLPPAGADPKALYVVFAGSNDFLRVLRGEATVASLEQTVANLVGAVATLRACGAKHIILVDVPNIGVTPRVLAADAFVPGTAAFVTDACRTFNEGLLETLAYYQLEVIHVSAFALVSDCAARPRRYGLRDVTTPSLPDLNKARHSMFWSEIHPTSRVYAGLAITMLEELRERGLLRHSKTPSCWRPEMLHP